MQAYSSLICTKAVIPDDVQALTGINPALLAERGRPIEQALRRVAGMINNREIVAYNTSFDLSFLQAEGARAGIEIMPSKVTCALEIARSTWPVLKRHRLSDLALYLGISPPSHRAMFDCLTGLQVFLKSRGAEPDTMMELPGLALHKLDIAELMACSDGERLILWTAPTYHSINAYREESPFGKGLVFSLPKNHPNNQAITQSLQDGHTPYITLSRDSKTMVRMVLKLFGDSPDDQ